MHIDTGKINEITGKPIKKLVPGEMIEVPCIFERTVSVDGSDSQPINLPDGQAHITLPYSTNPPNENWVKNAILFRRVYCPRY
ncbi:hypothetical protein [Bacillus pumilus]|uniref:hypothetical protein n=1 Tax=Bacillus pumilus TaxID=1408 RepID=UPI0031F4875D